MLNVGPTFTLLSALGLDEHRANKVGELDIVYSFILLKNFIEQNPNGKMSFSPQPLSKHEQHKSEFNAD